MEEDMDYLGTTGAEEVARLAKAIRIADKQVMKFALHTAEVPDKDQFLSDYVEVKILSDIAGSHKAMKDEWAKNHHTELPHVEEALAMVEDTLASTRQDMRNNLLSGGYPQESFDVLMEHVAKVSADLGERKYLRAVQLQKEHEKGN